MTGSEFKVFRKTHGISALDIASELGVTVPTIRKWESKAWKTKKLMDKHGKNINSIAIRLAKSKELAENDFFSHMKSTFEYMGELDNSEHMKHVLPFLLGVIKNVNKKNEKFIKGFMPLFMNRLEKIGQGWSDRLVSLYPDIEKFNDEDMEVFFKIMSEFTCSSLTFDLRKAAAVVTACESVLTMLEVVFDLDQNPMTSSELQTANLSLAKFTGLT